MNVNYKVLCADIGVTTAQTYADICVIEGNRKSHITSVVTGQAHAAKGRCTGDALIISCLEVGIAPHQLSWQLND